MILQNMYYKYNKECNILYLLLLFQQIQASISLLKGNIFEAMDNRGLATDCYKQALQYDVNCYEAFDGLIQHHMLTADEGSFKTTIQNKFKF